MQKTYCTSCGSKVEYSLAKPKFCSSCGEPLGLIAHSKTRTARTTSGDGEISDGDSTSYAHVPNVSKLQYDVDYGDLSLKKLTIEDLKQDGQQPRRRR
jgi:predicted RNA-binding Zn-ribbon protein involved in translation (DUF1610 family)